MIQNANCPLIDLAAIVWEPIGYDDDLRCRLLTAIRIGPLFMHLEALEVVPNFHDGYDAKYIERDDYLQALMNFEETTFERLEIDGRFYVLFATPYGD